MECVGQDDDKVYPAGFASMAEDPGIDFENVHKPLIFKVNPHWDPGIEFEVQYISLINGETYGSPVLIANR